MDSKRIVWGLLLAPLVVLFVLYAPLPFFKAVILLVGGICLKEFMTIALPKHPSSVPYLGVVLGMFFSGVLLFAERGSNLWIGSLALVLVVTFVYYLFCEHDLSIVLTQISLTVFGCVYVSCLFSYIGLLRGLERGTFWVFLTAGATFMADTSAFFAGHLFGRHKLAPRVSPGKTVEGLIGGVLGSIFAAFVCRFLFWKEFSAVSAVIIGLLVGLIGPLGDLSESLIKRSVGVKDSGQFIPGHGGLLDRVDALLFTGPLVYYYAAFFY
ncbi:MAG: phosphatidate cytidylyltransferase [bacterium]